MREGFTKRATALEKQNSGRDLKKEKKREG